MRRLIYLLMFAAMSCDNTGIDTLESIQTPPSQASVSASSELVCVDLCEYADNNYALYESRTVDFDNWSNTVYDDCKLRFDFGNRKGENHEPYGGNQHTYIINSGGANVLKIKMPENKVISSSGGSGIWTSTKIVPKNEAYLSFRVWFDDGFDWTAGSKLFGMCGGTCNVGGTSAVGMDGWSFRMNFKENDSDTTKADVYPYVYHKNMSGNHGETFGLKAYKVFERNKWHTVRFYVKMNDDGVQNGIFRVWIDDNLQPVLNKTDMEFREGVSQVDKVLLHAFPGGADSTIFAPNHTQFFRIDEISWWW